jgi:general secretion pathway protein B
MSYILDALRKADADRERDPSRGIHAQTVPTTSVPAAGRRGGPWAIGGLCVIAAAVAAWLWAGSGGTPEPVVATAPAAVSVPPAQPMPAEPPAPAAPAVATQVLPPPPPPVMQAPAPPAPVQKPAPPPAVSKAVPDAVAAAPAAAASAPATAPGASAAPAAAANAGRIVAPTELPPDIQRDLPKLAISGGVYSDNAAQRMLIVGGQVVNEGAELAPGAVLERIQPKAAVIRFRGWRYAVPY